MGYIAPLYDPIRIIEEAAVLDQVLHGRLELGLVSGIVPEYYNHYTHFLGSREDTFQQRREMTLELVSLVKAAFADPEPFSFEGRRRKKQP